MRERPAIPLEPSPPGTALRVVLLVAIAVLRFSSGTAGSAPSRPGLSLPASSGRCSSSWGARGGGATDGDSPSFSHPTAPIPSERPESRAQSRSDP